MQMVRDRRLARWLRRSINHLGRQRAGWAAAGLFAAGLVLAVFGTDGAVGQAGLVVVGTLISFILLPEEPARFWRVNARDLADVVPHSHLLEAGRETAAALAIQAGTINGHDHSSLLWNAASEQVTHALSDVNRLVLDMDYRISVHRDGDRQLMHSVVSSKRCWAGHDRVFFSFCTDVTALGVEFDTKGSISREIVELDPGETLDEWERRVRTYYVSLVVDGAELEVSRRDSVSIGHRSRALRIGFDIGDLPVSTRFVPMRLVSEFHQGLADRTFTVKFSTYYCLGPTLITIELDDSLLDVQANHFMRGARAGLSIIESRGLRSQQITLQTTADSVLTPGSGVVFTWAPGALLTSIPAELVRSIDDHVPADIAPLPAPGSLPTALVPTQALDEPMAALACVRCVDAYHRMGITSEPRTLMAREQVVARLERAQSLLPEGFSFVVLDAWRSHAVQQRVRDHYQATVPDLAEGFVADPQSPTTRPPHVVGGALDLTLAWHGRPMALGTPYDDFTSDAHVNAWEDPQRSSPTDRAIRLLRRLLASVLIEAGFAPYPQEWWHWSYGDDIWALRNGQPARYDVFVEEVDAPRSPGAGALDAGTPGPRA